MEDTSRAGNNRNFFTMHWKSCIPLLLQVHIYYALVIHLNQYTVILLGKPACCRLHLSTCILSWNGKYYSLQTDLVLEQVGEEFHRLRPSRLPSQSLTGSQERGLSSRVAPVDLSPTLHQQADQTKLTGGCCTDEGAGVQQGVPHGLVGKGKSDYIFTNKDSLCYNIQISTVKHLYCQPWTSFTCYIYWKSSPNGNANNILLIILFYQCLKI